MNLKPSDRCFGLLMLMLRGYTFTRNKDTYPWLRAQKLKNIQLFFLELSCMPN